MNQVHRESEMPQINIASREIVTRYQLDMCLAAMATAGGILGHYLRTPEESVSKLSPECPEARIALENTMTAACARLDKILAEESRWDMQFQLEVEKNYAHAQEQQRQLAAQQYAAAIEITSPHFRYRPTLFRMKDGSWCAFLGDINFMDSGVVGVGKSAQDAVEAFDDAFKGVTNQKVLAWVKQREHNLETGGVDLPFPNEQNQNEQSQTLDGLGATNSSEAHGGGDIPESDVREIGTECGLHNQPAPPFKHAEGGWLNKLRRLFHRGGPEAER